MDNKKIPTHYGTVIIVIIAITVGVLVWRYESRQQNLETQNVSQKSKSQSEISQLETKESDKDILIDGWRTYSDNSGYSIKYPSDWNSDFKDGASFFVKELQAPGNKSLDFGNVISDNYGLKDINGDYFINISVYKEKGLRTTLKEWRKQDGGNYQELSIDGNPAIKFEEKPHKSYDGKNKDMAGSLRYYFIDESNNGYEISVWYKDKSNGIGERIISTINLKK